MFSTIDPDMSISWCTYREVKGRSSLQKFSFKDEIRES